MNGEHKHILNFNIFLPLIVLLFCNTVFAQNSTFNNHIEYIQTLNLGDGDWDINYNLYFNKDVSLYYENYGVKERDETILNDRTISVVLHTTEKTADYYLSYLNSQTMLFGEFVGNDYYHFEEAV